MNSDLEKNKKELNLFYIMKLNLKGVWILLFLLALIFYFGPILYPNFMVFELFTGLISRLFLAAIWFFVVFYPWYQYAKDERSKFWGIATILALSFVLYVGIRTLFTRGIL